MSQEKTSFPLESTVPFASSNNTTIALIAVFASLILYACIPILLKISESDLTANATIFNRCWIATAMLGCWNIISGIKKQSFTVQVFPSNFSNTWFLLCLLGIFSVGHFLLYARSLTQTSVANSEVLHSLTPLFTTFIGWMFLGQQFDRRFLLGIAIAIGGSIILVANDFSIALNKLQGDELALVSAIFWGGCLLILEKLQTQLNPIIITTWNELIGSICLLPILLIGGDNLIPTSGKIWAILTAMGIIGIFARILITYSLKQLSSGLVAIILLLHPAITAILAWVIFSEFFSLTNFLGFTIILLGVYLTTLSKVGIKKGED
ncbi:MULTISPECIES: DMT family transporter [Spirulina sp. CCY15215]|uniref:DMT family transporter n=1 Tax=Spirulina sp. CCY15215 TaxID=2767591 RepID=UPI001951BDF0|nr:DMT family transporter [Spirulina major]